MFKIESRRYIGSKTKLLSSILEEFGENKKVVDIFGGTGVVAAYASQKNSVIVNDLLFSNYIVYDAFLGKKKINLKKLNDYERLFNSFANEVLPDNYFSDNFGGNYFDFNVAKIIGHIREYIYNLNEDDSIKNILVASLMYSMDRYANTVGHYEMYLKNTKVFKKDFVFKLIKLDMRGRDVSYYQEDANKLIEKISGDILYLDPPYNARQYINFYHIWENLAKWEKPVVKWESKKFEREGLKSKYSTSSAPQQMQELINKASSKFSKIIVSYNNTYNAKSGASNNKISYEQMVDILSKNGDLNVVELEHKFFNSGKTDFENHKELLFVLTVNK